MAKKPEGRKAQSHSIYLTVDQIAGIPKNGFVDLVYNHHMEICGPHHSRRTIWGGDELHLNVEDGEPLYVLPIERTTLLRSKKHKDLLGRGKVRYIRCYVEGA
jgi:hypothetical protein